MYSREFFASKLGLAALVSIAAMVSFNAFALTQQLGNTAEAVVGTEQRAAVELA